MSNCEINLQQVANFCSTHSDLLPLSGVGGYTNEPFLSLVNDALSEILSSPNDFVFNRSEMPLFVTCPNRQDVLFAGATGFTMTQGWGIGLATASAITVSGSTVTVTFLEPHRLSVGDVLYMAGNTIAAFNSTFTDDGNSSAWTGGWTITAKTSMTVSFVATTGQTDGLITGAPGIKDFSYGTSASMVEMNNVSSPQRVLPLTVMRELPVSSTCATPEKVCILFDLGTGVLKMRFLPVPSEVLYGINVVYQRKAPIKVSLTDKWNPIPDEYAAMYRQALLYRMYRYLNSPTAPAEYAKLQAEIAKVQAADDASPTDVQLEPEEGLMESGGYYGFGW